MRRDPTALVPVRHAFRSSVRSSGFGRWRRGRFIRNGPLREESCYDRYRGIKIARPYIGLDLANLHDGQVPVLSEG